MEQLFNLYSSTLASGYTAGSHTASLTSASGLPTSGVFTLVVLDQTTLAAKVIFTVSAISGTTITVTAEGSDTNCIAGDIVVGYILTVRSLKSNFQDWLGFDAQANLPSASARSTGQRFKAKDSPVEYLLDDGSENSPVTSPVWSPRICGIPGTPPDHTAFTSFNSAGTGITFTQNNAGNWITIREQGSSTTGQICGLTKSKLAATFTAKFQISAVAGGLNTDVQVGICVSDGTKYIVMALQWFSGGVYLNVSKWNSATSFNADYFAVQGVYAFGPLPCLVVQEDGVNRSWYLSPDGGRTLCLVKQTLVADFLSTTKVGIFIRGDNAANDTALTLWALDESNP